MELILKILYIGNDNPTVSLAVAAVFLFVYSVYILRKRRAFKDATMEDLKNLENVVDAEKAGYNSRGYYASSTAKSEANLKAIRKASAVVDNYNHLLLAGFVFCIPVYFLWAPLLLLLIPITLAWACVYPDKLRALISKSVDTKAVSE